MSFFERLKQDALPEWQGYVGHPFVMQLGDGTLPKICFQRYLVQDYLFLIQFARCYALAVYKSPTLGHMQYGLEGLKAILDVEMDLHVRLCASWGMSKEQLLQATELNETVAYTRFVLDVGQSGDLLDLYVALSPCMIGYGEIGRMLSGQAGVSNPYSAWIEEYSGEGYQSVVKGALSMLDQLANERLTEARYETLLQTFKTATNLEADFWQMGLSAK